MTPASRGAASASAGEPSAGAGRNAPLPEAPDSDGPSPSGRGSQGNGRPADEDKSAPARPTLKASIDRLLVLAEAEEARRLRAIESNLAMSLAILEQMSAQIDRERRVILTEKPRPWWRRGGPF